MLTASTLPEEFIEEKKSPPRRFFLTRDDSFSTQQLQVLESIERTVGDKRISEQSLPVPAGVNVCGMTSDVVFAGRTATASNVLNEAMGYFTGIMAIGGVFNSLNSYKAFKRATFTSDRWSVVSSSLTSAAGVSQVVFSLGYLANRITYIASAVKRVPQTLSSPSSLGKAAAYTGFIGDGGFTLFGGFLGLFSLVRMGELGRFGWMIRKNSSDKQSLEFLLKESEFDVSAWFREVSHENPDFQADCEKLGQEVLVREVVAGKKEENDEISSEDAAIYLNGILDEEAAGKLSEELTRYIAGDFSGWNPFALVGLIVKIQRHQAQREEKMERRIGATLCHRIKKIKKMGVIPRLCNTATTTKASQECRDLKSNIFKELFFRIGTHFALLSLSGVAMALGVMSIMMTVGLAAFPPATLLALTIVFTVLCFVVDFGPFKAALFASKPNKLNYGLLALSTVCIIASFATGVGLFVAGHFVTVELIKLIVTTVVSLGINAYAFYRFKKREKEWIKEHPTLTHFKEALEAQNAEAALLPENDALFKKLSKEDRIALREQISLTREYRNCNSCELTNKKHEFVSRGVKKAVSRSWEQYNQDQKNTALFKNACDLQVLQDRLRDGQLQESLRKSKTIEDFLMSAHIKEAVNREAVRKGFAEIVVRQNRQVLENAVNTVLNARS
jgi:hypothetical protein